MTNKEIEEGKIVVEEGNVESNKANVSVSYEIIKKEDD